MKLTFSKRNSHTHTHNRLSASFFLASSWAIKKRYGKVCANFPNGQFFRPLCEAINVNLHFRCHSKIKIEWNVLLTGRSGALILFILFFLCSLFVVRQVKCLRIGKPSLLKLNRTAIKTRVHTHTFPKYMQRIVYLYIKMKFIYDNHDEDEDENMTKMSSFGV